MSKDKQDLDQGEFYAAVVIAEVAKVQTLAAGGFRVTIDVPAIYAKQAGWLLSESVKTGQIHKILFSRIDPGDPEDPESTEDWL